MHTNALILKVNPSKLVCASSLIPPKVRLVDESNLALNQAAKPQKLLFRSSFVLICGGVFPKKVVQGQIHQNCYVNQAWSHQKWVQFNDPCAQHPSPASLISLAFLPLAPPSISIHGSTPFSLHIFFKSLHAGVSWKFIKPKTGGHEIGCQPKLHARFFGEIPQNCRTCSMKFDSPHMYMFNDPCKKLVNPHNEQPKSPQLNGFTRAPMEGIHGQMDVFHFAPHPPRFMIPELSCCRLMVLLLTFKCFSLMHFRVAKKTSSTNWVLLTCFEGLSNLRHARNSYHMYLHPSVCVKSWRIKFNQINKQINYFTIICLLKRPPTQKKKHHPPRWVPPQLYPTALYKKAAPQPRVPTWSCPTGTQWNSDHRSQGWPTWWEPNPPRNNVGSVTGNPQIRIHGKKKTCFFPFDPHGICWIFEWVFM